MKSVILSIVFVGMLCGTSFAQSTIDCDGYAVNVPAYVWLNDALASSGMMNPTDWVDVTRLRLRPVLSLSETGFIALEYDVAATVQSGLSAFLDPSSTNRRQLVNLRWGIVRNDRWTVVHSIDRLYYRQQIGSFDISLGRQRVAWGSGRIWNPTDLFNPLNPTTFSKIEKDGIDAAIVKLTLGTLSDVTLVHNPQHDNPSNYACRIRTNWREFDLVGIAGYFDQRVILGGDVAGNVFDAGVRSEMILSVKKENPSERFVKAVFGADYQWTAELYTLVEYHHNGEGETNPARYDLSRLVSGEVLNVGVDYLAVSASYLIHPLVTTSLTCTENLNDGSVFLALSGVYVPSDEISITLGGHLFIGNRLDEYWYYPSSSYAKLEIFF